MGRGSLFDQYDGKIEELLFLGYSLRETYDYLEKYFDLFTSYKNFIWHVKARHLDWFMPSKY